LLAKPRKLVRLLSGITSVSDEVAASLAPYLEREDLSRAKLKGASAACESLSLWLHGVCAKSSARRPTQQLGSTALHLVEKEDVKQLPPDGIAGQTDLEGLHARREELQVALPVFSLCIEREKTAADAELQAALPALEAAVAALDAVSRGDIVELKSFAAPPLPVMIVCMCVVVLRPLGNEDEHHGWAGAKRMLANAGFLRSLREFNKDAIEEAQIKRVEELLAKEGLKDDAMLKISKAAYGLLQWVKAMVTYYHVAMKLGPKRQEVRELQHARAQAEFELEQITAALKAPPAAASSPQETCAPPREADAGAAAATADADAERPGAAAAGPVPVPAPDPAAELAGIQAAAAIADETTDFSALPLLPPVHAALEALLEAPLTGLRLAALDLQALDPAAVGRAARRAAAPDFSAAALQGRSRGSALVADWLVRVLKYHGADFALGREAEDQAACDGASNSSSDSWTLVVA